MHNVSFCFKLYFIFLNISPFNQINMLKIYSSNKEAALDYFGKIEMDNVFSKFEFYFV